ncbi:hypothetical protein BLJ79_06055 [Arthrobacter sp. UCD-GKA]|nr:PhnD/SsuA/transferrin family substrate-binding protein [Arthrobacter sp. UCD-GKA]OIH85713.1 hypothetical protein BLJ79_06055 [Arthrobacter sp. UCD-GKA]
MTSTQRAQRFASVAAILAAGTFALSACGSTTATADAAPADNTLVFAMPPGTDDPDILSEAKVIQGFIAEATGKDVTREMPADYLGVVEAVRQGHVDVAVMSPFSTALAVKNGSVDPLIVWNKDATNLPPTATPSRAAASNP